MPVPLKIRYIGSLPSEALNAEIRAHVAQLEATGAGLTRCEVIVESWQLALEQPTISRVTVEATLARTRVRDVQGGAGAPHELRAQLGSAFDGIARALTRASPVQLASVSSERPLHLGSTQTRARSDGNAPEHAAAASRRAPFA